MKKKILVFICMFLGVINVGAKDYYSKYSDYSEWTTTPIESSDTIYVQKETRYKYYHEEKDGEYYKYGENVDIYPNLDKDNFYYGEYSEYSKEYPSTAKYREIEEVDAYEYQTVKKISQIYIGSIHGGDDKFKITEISILDKNDNEINYTYECDGCSDNFDENIHNGVVVENFSYIENEGQILIYLDKPYNYDEIKVKLYLYDNTSEYKYFYITYVSDRDYILRYNFFEDFKSESLTDIKEYIYNYENMTQSLTWEDSIISFDAMEENAYTKINKISMYRYRDKYFYYYKINKIYSVNYLPKATEYYTKKTDDSLTYYRYKTRDKLSITDEIIINDKASKLEDYVMSTTPVDIESNLDINTNGTYKVRYITPFKTVNKNVVVDIEINDLTKKYEDLMDSYEKITMEYNELSTKSEEKDIIIPTNVDDNIDVSSQLIELSNSINSKNSVDSYNKLITELNDYKMKVNELNMQLEETKLALENKEVEKNKIAKEFENELINIKLKDNSAELNECSNSINTFPLLKIPNNYIWILPFLFLIIIIIVLILYKKRNKN
ncbi:MAG: hypothetical protein IJ565_05600 [Bacilli bacterium]|nr:hypothetical protein [Bacilli bacterium]